MNSNNSFSNGNDNPTSEPKTVEELRREILAGKLRNECKVEVENDEVMPLGGCVDRATAIDDETNGVVAAKAEIEEFEDHGVSPMANTGIKRKRDGEISGVSGNLESAAPSRERDQVKMSFGLGRGRRHRGSLSTSCSRPEVEEVEEREEATQGESTEDADESSHHQTPPRPVITYTEDGRKIICPKGLWFKDNTVVRGCTTSTKSSMSGGYTCWSAASDEDKESWFNIFRRAFYWDPTLESIVRERYNATCQRRLKDNMYKVAKRKKAPKFMEGGAYESLRSIAKLRNLRLSQSKLKSTKGVGNKRDRLRLLIMGDLNRLMSVQCHPIRRKCHQRRISSLKLIVGRTTKVKGSSLAPKTRSYTRVINDQSRTTLQISLIMRFGMRRCKATRKGRCMAWEMHMTFTSTLQDEDNLQAKTKPTYRGSFLNFKSKLIK